MELLPVLIPGTLVHIWGEDLKKREPRQIMARTPHQYECGFAEEAL